MTKSGFVAIIGRPNVGKSTLLNEVMGSDLSIVTPKAQTTRKNIRGILTTEKGQIVFIDTPGIHAVRAGGLNEIMVKDAKHALDGASLIWYLIEQSSQLEHENKVIECLPRNIPIFLIKNKTDLPNMNPHSSDKIRDALKNRGCIIAKIFEISAKSKTGVDPLMESTWQLMEEGERYYPDPEMLSDRPVRFFVAEKIREHLFMALSQELPYSCDIELTAFKEQKDMFRIEATIHVERDSQKGIVIGKNGSMLKSIGQASREDIEKMLDKKVFLGLKVKVSKDWSHNENYLRLKGHFSEERSRER
jgi:GTP-binding protein Era